MPIYEYKCTECKQEFEKLVFSNQKVMCPKCKLENVKKKFSLFGMSGVENPTSSGCPPTCSSSCSSCK